MVVDGKHIEVGITLSPSITLYIPGISNNQGWIL